MAYAPSDPWVVWAWGYELLPNWDTVGRAYRSEDGGASVGPVVVDGDDGGSDGQVRVTNGSRLYPHPDDPTRVYWAVGSCFSFAGVNLYSYEHASGISRTVNHNYGGINEVSASPADSNMLYLGLEGGGFIGPECPAPP